MQVIPVKSTDSINTATNESCITWLIFDFVGKNETQLPLICVAKKKKKRPKSQLRLTHKFIYGRNIKQLTTQSTEFRCSETRHEKSQIERNMELFNLQSQQTTNMNKPSTQNATNTPN